MWNTTLLSRVPGRDWIKGTLESVLEAEPIQTVALKAQKAIDSFKKGSKQHKHDLLNDWILSMTIIWIEPRTFSDSSARDRGRCNNKMPPAWGHLSANVFICAYLWRQHKIICATEFTSDISVHSAPCYFYLKNDHIYMPLTCTTIQNLLHFCRETMCMIVTERSKHL